jgi:hypothetical protein
MVQVWGLAIVAIAAARTAAPAARRTGTCDDGLRKRDEATASTHVGCDEARRYPPSRVPPPPPPELVTAPAAPPAPAVETSAACLAAPLESASKPPMVPYDEL